jgi:hypothetical protein
MSNKEANGWYNRLQKLLVFFSFLAIFSLGVHYRPSASFDYNKEQPVEKEGVVEINFDFLSGFDYEKEIIPEQIEELNGKKIAIAGFMLPVDFEQSKVTSFILLNNQMGCCFGIMPRMNEFIYVKMKTNTSTEFITDIPIIVLGRFEIGEENVIGSLYGMEAEKVEISKGL